MPLVTKKHIIEKSVPMLVSSIAEGRIARAELRIHVQGRPPVWITILSTNGPGEPPGIFARSNDVNAELSTNLPSFYIHALREYKDDLCVAIAKHLNGKLTDGQFHIETELQ